MHATLRRVLLVALAIVPLGVFVPVEDVSGQYFGRNKVQYDQFDFSVLRTQHFDIYHYEEARDAAVQAGRMAERWYARLSRVLDHELRGRQPIVLYANHPDFRQTNTTPQQIGEGTGGLTEFLKRRIVLPMAGSMQETDHVLGHELVHAFQFDITGQGPGSVGMNVPVALRLPLWFIEGMAEYLSVGTEDPFTAMWMRGATQAEELPDMGDLANPRYFPYRFGHSFWAYVGGRWGDQSVGRILKRVGRTGDLRAGLTQTLGIRADSLVDGWHEAVRAHANPILERTRPPTEYGQTLIHSDSGGSDLNMSPVLSPDGNELVFTSERSRFSVELFLADARTGEVKRKLTETALDPHFESLQYLASSGAWAPDGDRFVLGAITRGTPVLSIIDVRSGRRVQEIRLPEIGEIFNPTWSPDGTRIAFSAQVGGVLDLFVADLASEEITRLTEDAYAELHPAWSPDGDRLAFTTDRFGADFDLLRFGNYRLATIEVGTGEIREVAAFAEGKHTNPQWSPDGEELYFISNRTGISNLYRMDLESGRTYQVTDLHTGVAGISALSPALSVASETGEVVFSVHGEGNFIFDLYRVGSPEVLAGEAVEATHRLADLRPAALPPLDRPGSQVEELLADARLGLANPVTFETEDYEPQLALDFVGRPNLAVGSDQFGFFAGGGGSLYFSDMLGNRNLSTIFQVDGSGGKILQSTALFGQYENRRHRWNWAVLGGQLPLISQFFNVIPVEGGLIVREFRFWQVNRELTGALQYPISRFQRLELSAGFRNIEFTSRVRDRLVVGGQVVDERELDDPCFFGQAPDEPGGETCTIDPMNVGRGSAALVYDNSIFGGTGPVLGQRYRLEVSPTIGSIDYYTVLADYRRYIMPLEPITLAGRLEHFARYGPDGEDSRLRQFFIGNPGLIRGYNAGSFDAAIECRSQQDCPVFGQLLGSRVALANAEARLPLLGALGVLPSAGFPPVDMVAFFDAGVAWNKGQNPTIFGGERDLVRSVGVGARMNLFGLAIFELDYVNPLDRPDKDWYLQFNLVPGF